MKIKLDDRQWKSFKFVDIFIIKKGFYNKKPQTEDNGVIPFLGAVKNNNGITEFYSLKNIDASSKNGNNKNVSIDKKIFKGNCICVTNNGSVGYAYYQKNNFTCSHDVNPLYLKNYKLNKYIAMFLITSIEKQRVCFQYSRKWRPKRMKKSNILLPIKPNVNQPDYEFMELYIKEKYIRKKNKYNNYKEKVLKNLKYKKIETLDEKKWGKFKLNEICHIYSGKDIYRSERIEGERPYITSTALNNGIKYFVSNKNKTIDNNAISINRNGSVGYAFYHKYKALYSNDCRKLKLKQNNNEFVALFLTNQIMQQKNKYNYGYKMGTARLKKQYIILPINCKNEPDYEYMEQYIKNLMIKKYNQYN